MEAKEIIKNARIQLVMKYPFLGSLAIMMPVIESKEAGEGTTCVDEKGVFYYNPEWVEKMSVPDAMFEVAHEVMHLVQRCSDRYPSGGNHNLWNMAADMVVDTMLIESSLPQSEVSKKVITPNVQKHASGKTTEQIYRELLKQTNTNSGSGDGQSMIVIGEKNEDGTPKGNGQGAGERKCISGCLGKKVDAETKEKWKQNIINAVNQSRNRGNIPGWANEFVANISKPSVNWRHFIRSKAQSAFRGRFSWIRPGRRSSAIGFRLMSRKPSPKGAVVMIDTSGSISDRELNQFVSECMGILKTTNCAWLKIYFHDVECYHFEEYDKNSIKKIKVTRGGTSHIDVFEKVIEHEKDVGLVVAFTDLGTCYPNEKPPFNVIWAYPEGNGDHSTPPWGHKIKVSLT